VIRNLLKYLDVPTILNLRLVSTSTKSWISCLSSGIIDRLPVPIFSNNDITSVINVNVENPHMAEAWAAFRLMPETVSSYLDKEHVHNLFAIFSQSISTLVLSHIRDPVIIFDIMQNHCINLKSLSISILDISAYPHSDFLNDRESKHKYSFLKKLHHLLLGKLVFEDQKGLEFYRLILNQCNSLSSLKIPYILPNSPASLLSFSEVKDIQLSSIVSVTQQYLLNAVNKPSSRKRLVLDVSQVNSKHFEPLVHTCVQIDAFVSNVNDKQVKYTFLNENDFLTRILSLREKIDDRRSLECWINLESLYVRTSRCDIRNVYLFEDYNGSTIFPNLKNLTVVFDSCSRNDPGFFALEKIISLLLKTRRETVQRLALKWSQYGHDTPKDVVGILDVVNNFPTLRNLTLINADWDLGKIIDMKGSDFVKLWLAKLNIKKSISLSSR
jgi:hypothetical protein